MTVTKQVSLHGKRVFVTIDDQLAARNGFVAGGDDKPSIVLPGSPDTTAIYEDFHGDDLTGDDTGKPLFGGPFRALVGDTGHTNDKQAGTNGVFRLLSTPSTTATKAATAGVGIGTGSLDWKGNQGPGDKSGRLRFGARLKLQTVEQAEAAGNNRMHVYLGFTDVGTYEFPVYDTGAGLINNASDFVGFLFSPGGDTGWTGVSKKSTSGDSGIQVVALDTGIAANIYDTVEVEYNRGISDTGGRATFYINGIPVGAIDSPIVPTVGLQPVALAWLQDTGGNYVDLDWVNVAAPRDTGL